MANILEFLRGVLTNGGEQQQFGNHPKTYLNANGFGDLSGEDVTEAMRVLARTLPDDIAGTLSPYLSNNGSIPSVRPQVNETELDAAVRQLQFAVSLVPPVEAVPEPIGTGTEPEPDAEEPEATEATEASGAPAAPEQSEAEATTELEPVAEETEQDLKAAADQPTSEQPESAQEPEREPVPNQTEQQPVAAASGGGDVDTSSLDEELAAITQRTSGQLKELMRRADERAAERVSRAEVEAEAIRQQANTDAQTVRDMASQEADGILQSAKSQREEAGAEMQKARAAQEDAERVAAEIRKNAEQDAAGIIAEAKARRDEVRTAEQELRNRLQGLQSVFQSLEQGSVLPDDS